MKWFNNPQTLEELKEQYRKLALKNHPDLGGSTQAMQEINAEYEALFARLKNVHKAASGETYTEKEETAEKAADFIEIINRLINLDGLIIEICGKWLWISGNTKPYKETLKELHFRWSSNKMAWYLHFEPFRKRSNKSLSLDEIRDLYGSETVKGETKTTYNLHTALR